MSGLRFPARSIRFVAVSLAVALLATSCSGGGDSVAVSGAADQTTSAPADADTGTDGETVEASEASAPAGPSIVDGRITDAALASLLDGDVVNSERVQQLLSEIVALPEDQRIAIGNDLAMRAELEAAKITGLDQAAGGPEALEASLRGAYGQVAGQVDGLAASAPDVAIAPDAAAPATTTPSGLRSGLGRSRGVAPAALQDAPSASGVAAVGMFMAFMGLGMMADVISNAGNEAKAGAPPETRDGDGTKLSASLSDGSVRMDFNGTQDGVAVKFKAEVVTHPCPKPDGTVDVKVKIEIQASKDGRGQNAWVTLDIAAQVDDNANLAGYDVTSNTQWADYAAGSKGSFIDFSITSGDQGGTAKPQGFTTNRKTGATNSTMEVMAVLMTGLLQYDTAKRYIDGAQKAWQSGRCVQLDLSASAGPSGLEPNEQVTVTAKPKSKIDGAPAGGNVTATMSAGGASVEPSSTPVPADAEFTYTAPDERDKSGTVSAEARSKRGVGKASITLDTKAEAAYVIAGGLQDFQVNQTVCDIMSPFTLNGGVGTADFDGGLSGTYSATGSMFSYQGTYSITLSDGLGSPGSMSATSSGQIGGQAASGTETYVLTPTTC